MPDKYKPAAFAVTFLAAIMLFFTFMIWQEGNKEGSEQCYKDFPVLYTYPELRPQLREFWLDQNLTIAECRTMDDLYANINSMRNKADITQRLHVMDGERK